MSDQREVVVLSGVRTAIGDYGGALKDICDIAIHVKTKKGEYGPVEDIHIILDHLIYTWFRQKTQKEKLNEIVGR